MGGQGVVCSCVCACVRVCTRGSMCRGKPTREPACYPRVGRLPPRPRGAPLPACLPPRPRGPPHPAALLTRPADPRSLPARAAGGSPAAAKRRPLGSTDCGHGRTAVLQVQEQRHQALLHLRPQAPRLPAGHRCHQVPEQCHGRCADPVSLLQGGSSEPQPNLPRGPHSTDPGPHSPCGHGLSSLGRRFLPGSGSQAWAVPAPQTGHLGRVPVVLKDLTHCSLTSTAQVPRV